MFTSSGRHDLKFFSFFSAVKTEHEESVEYVSSYVLEKGDDSVIYQGFVKTEPPSSDSYMADESAESSVEMANVDYTQRLIELYNSRRNSIAIGTDQNDDENGEGVPQTSTVLVKVEPLESCDMKIEPSVKQETD